MSLSLSSILSLVTYISSTTLIIIGAILVKKKEIATGVISIVLGVLAIAKKDLSPLFFLIAFITIGIYYIKKNKKTLGITLIALAILLIIIPSLLTLSKISLSYAFSSLLVGIIVPVALILISIDFLKNKEKAFGLLILILAILILLGNVIPSSLYIIEQMKPCTDSNNGTNYEVGGSCKGRPLSGNDHCVEKGSTELIEYYCTPEDQTCHAKRIDCHSYCVEKGFSSGICEWGFPSFCKCQ